MKSALVLVVTTLATLGCETHRKNMITEETSRLTCGVVRSTPGTTDFTGSIHKLKWISIDGGVYQTLVNSQDASQ